MSDFAYSVETGKSHSDAIVALRAAAEKNKWTVLGSYDFSEILASKGFDQGIQIKLMDLCNAGHANYMLGQDLETVLCMPCNVSIVTRQGTTKISAIRPATVMPPLFAAAGEGLAERSRQVEAELVAILDEAAS
jgi:uncharacterized protein (DUF302 family)